MHLRILRWFEMALLVTASVLWVSSDLAAKSKGDQPQEQVQSGAANASEEAGWHYVGSQTCAACHDELYKHFEKSPHFATTEKTNMTDGGHGCEACHGPGSAHVEGGGDKTKIFRYTTARPDQISRRCLTCHESNIEQQQFLRSVHNQNGISCTSCHSVHNPVKREYLLRATNQTNLCFTCHVTQRADFLKPFRHRVTEGLISCSDCHNPHGTVRRTQLRATADQNYICYKCHADKRGPFVFEHEPVRVEGCTTCHFPHGSVNPRMLLTARTNSLCLQCHSLIPSGPHPQNSTARQSCIICHASIHGSNNSSILFQ